MSDQSLLPVIYTRLAVCACDPTRLEELARYYEAHGKPDAAACVRWARANDVRPFCYSRQAPLAQHSDVWHQGWYWWATREPGPAGEWGQPAECRLPHDLWLRLRHSFPYPPVVFKEFATLQLAFEALIEAWTGWAAPDEPPPVRAIQPSAMVH